MREHLRSLLRLASSGTPMARIARGSLWSALSTLLARGLTFAAVVFAARILGRELFGRFGILQGAIASFASVGTLGMAIAAAKLVAERRTRSLAHAASAITASLWIAAGAGLVLSLAVAANAPYLANAVLEDATLTDELRVASLALLLGCLAAAQTGALAGLEAFATMAAINAVVGVTTLVGLPWLASTHGLQGAIWALAGAAAVHCLANQVALHRTLIRLGTRRVDYLRGGDFRAVLAVGIPAALSSLLYLPANWICATLLTRTPGGYAEMAVFTAVDQWFNIILTVQGVVGQAMLPVMAGVFALGVGSESRRLFLRALLGNAALSALPMLFLIPLGPALLRLYGPSYSAYAWAFAVTVATAGLASTLAPATQAMVAAGKLWQGFALNLVWAITYVGATYLLVVRPEGGVLQLATARLIAYGGLACWLTAYVHHALRTGTFLPNAAALAQSREHPPS